MCSRCDEAACFVRQDDAVCLRHLLVCATERPRSKWRRVAPVEGDAVEAAWQDCFAKLARVLSRAAADELTKTDDDPLAALLEERPPPPAPQREQQQPRGPTSRKRTRPSVLWATAPPSQDEQPPLQQGDACPACGSTDTRVMGGVVHAQKTEVWGTKEDVDPRTTCLTCNHSWD